MNLYDHGLLVRDRKEKDKRVKIFLKKKNLDALIINRQDNFSWFTSGGDSHVFSSSEQGAAFIVITKNRKYLCAYPMDGYRIMNEEIKNCGFELKTTNWYEDNPLTLAKKLIKGKKVGSDIIINKAEFLSNELVDLHYPLTDLEVNRYIWLGKKCDEYFANIAMEVKPGQTEYQVGAVVLKEFYRNGISIDVLIIGSDERIFKYRHPMPTNKKIDKYVLLAVSVKKWGLHANISRLIYFGKPPAEILNKYRAACIIQASIIDFLKPGMLFKDVFEFIKKQYKKLGYPEEWKKHYQGAITGYITADLFALLSEDKKARSNQTFTWIVTITGVKSEELSFLNEEKAKFLSVAGHWPRFSFNLNNKRIDMPDIMIM